LESAIPIAEAVEPEVVFPLAILKLRMVLLEITLTSAEEAIPWIKPAVDVVGLLVEFVRLIIVLLVI